MSDPLTLARWLSALANSGGGTLAVPRSPRPTAWPARSTRDLIAQAIERTAPTARVRPARAPEVDPRRLHLVVAAAPATLGPVLVRTDTGAPKAFVLRRDRPHALSPRELTTRLRVAGLAPDELDAAASRDLPGAAVRTLCQRLGLDPHDHAALRQLGLHTPHGRPTIAAAVALAQESRVRWRRFAGPSGHPFPEPFVDTTRSLPIDEVLAWTYAVCPPCLGARAAPAVREALLNAVVHRSYAPAHRAAPIELEVFLDAVRVTSPGPALARTLVDDVPRGPFPRNPRLASFLQCLGTWKGHGTGIRALLAGERGARVTLATRADAVAVTLTPGPEPHRLPAPRYRRRSTRELEDALVLQLEAQGPLTRSQLQELLGVSRSRIGQLVSALLGAGRIEDTCPRARSPRQAYRLPAA